MKERTFDRFLLLAGLLSSAEGQATTEGSDTGSAPIWSLTTKIDAGSSNICGGTFNDANATGIYYINPNVLQGPQPGQDNTSGRTLQSGLAVTIQSESSTSNFSNITSSSYGLWYNTNGANYSGDFALGYDVCALVGYSLNYNTQLRGQDDDGTCSSALDSACISDLEAVTAKWSDWLSTPSAIGPGSNLTNTSLPTLCNTLARNVKDDFPTSCSYFFQDSALDGLGWPLTSNGDNYDTVLSDECMLNGTWQNAVSLYGNNSQSLYTAWARAVTPVLFAFMPVADSGATTRISSSKAELTCLHIDQINENSYDPPDTPSPTPIAYNATESNTATPSPAASIDPIEDSLTGGAIAGIAVGGVAALIAIVSGLFFWLRRKRRAQKTTTSGYDNLGQEGTAGQKVELSNDNDRYELEGLARAQELEGKDARHQLPATYEEGGGDNRQWLDGVEIQRQKLEDQRPVELP